MSDTVILSISIVASLLLGVLIGYFVDRYRRSEGLYAGEIVVMKTETGKTVYSLNLNCDPEDLLWQDKVLFYIVGDRE